MTFVYSKFLPRLLCIRIEITVYFLLQFEMNDLLREELEAVEAILMEGIQVEEDKERIWGINIK